MNYKTILGILGIIFGITLLPIAASAQTDGIPSWIKNSAGWWSEGLISDSEFMDAIEYLIAKGTIQIQIFPTVTQIDTITIGFIPTETAEQLTPNPAQLKQNRHQ